MLPGERQVAGLTCSEVLADLSAYLDGELEPGRKAQIEGHVSECQTCASFGASFGSLLADVRARMTQPEPVPADVEARLKHHLRSILEPPTRRATRRS